MFELPTRVFVDMGMNRKKAIVLVVAVVYLLGIPSAKNLNLLSNQDYVWGIALMISGAFIAFAIIKYGIGLIIDDLNSVKGDWRTGLWWSTEIRFLIPVGAAILLIWWLFQSATVFAPRQWYNPLNAFSVMTCVLQWFVILALLLFFNRSIARKLKI